MLPRVVDWRLNPVRRQAASAPSQRALALHRTLRIAVAAAVSPSAGRRAGVFLHECEVWNRHLGKYILAFKQLTTALTGKLPPGSMWFWACDWTFVEEEDRLPADNPALIRWRPRFSHHGGATRTAVAA